MSVAEQVTVMRAARRERRLDHFPYLALLPLTLLLAAFTFFPVGYAGWSSLHELLLSRPQSAPFIGLGNYAEVVASSYFRSSLVTTLLFTVVTTAVTLVLGLAFALLLNAPLRSARVAQVLVLLPWAIPTVAAGIMWRWIFNGSYGPFNGLLYSAGLIREYVPWLGESLGAQLAVSVAHVWRSTPLPTLLFLASLQLIPRELVEAVRIDGGGAFQALRNVALPLLRPTIMIVAIYQTIVSLTTFDLVYVMTGGGPGDATSLLSYFTYVEIFKGLNVGTGSALAFLLGLVSLIFIGAYLYLLKSESLE